MPCYTCITSNRNLTHITQHFEISHEAAFRQHISEIPFYEGINPIGDELYWLQSIALGKQAITLEPVTKCKNTWKWKEGENYSPVYKTYIIKTDSQE